MKLFTVFSVEKHFFFFLQIIQQKNELYIMRSNTSLALVIDLPVEHLRLELAELVLEVGVLVGQGLDDAGVPVPGQRGK